jgi:predicted acetyltransferase
MNKTPLVLRKLDPRDEKAFMTALSEWDNSEGFLFMQGYVQGTSYLDYLELLRANERGERLPEGYVAATTLCAFVGDEIVGRLSFRHRLNDFLLKVGGHIGYGVLPTHRRHGYAKEMLAQALPIARSYGILNVLVTCDDNNLGSIKTIEANKGHLENTVEFGHGKPMKRRYWIHTGDLYQE